MSYLCRTSNEGRTMFSSNYTAPTGKICEVHFHRFQFEGKTGRIVVSKHCRYFPVF